MSGNLGRAPFRTCGCSLSVNSVNAPSFPMVKVISIAYTDSVSSVNRGRSGGLQRRSFGVDAPAVAGASTLD